jgi:hypothetical protein
VHLGIPRCRCTWGFPGIRLFETGRTYHSQGAPVDCRCTSITPDAPVKIAGAPGDARCALGMTGAPGIRVFETGRICHSQGAPVDRRWISITPGASLEYQGHPGRRQGRSRAWVSGSLQPLSECGCSSRRRKTVPLSGCRVAVFHSPAPCTAGRWAIPAGAQATRGDAPPKVSGQECRSSPVLDSQIR